MTVNIPTTCVNMEHESNTSSQIPPALLQSRYSGLMQAHVQPKSCKRKIVVYPLQLTLYGIKFVGGIGGGGRGRMLILFGCW